MTQQELNFSIQCE